MARFAKGHAKTAGRGLGTPNKATAEIKELARIEGPGVIALFAAIYRNPKKPDAIRLQAGKELLDRGYGKPVQPLGSDPDEPIVVQIIRFADLPKVIEDDADPSPE
jgi:hypothetical protein